MMSGAVIPTRGATCHTARATIGLKTRRLVTAPNFTFWTFELASRSCDLTPLDYFCGAMYSHWSMRISHKRFTIWRASIRRVIADIRPQMLEKSSKIGRPDWTHPSQPWQSYARNHI
ncbi:hypothetical protein TNCV_2009671 [Trichonephila clavipes]|nr:hypothetical protein TNCV_2009671 [Trichonephila clavipes]